MGFAELRESGAATVPQYASEEGRPLPDGEHPEDYTNVDKAALVGVPFVVTGYWHMSKDDYWVLFAVTANDELLSFTGSGPTIGSQIQELHRVTEEWPAIYCPDGLKASVYKWQGKDVTSYWLTSGE